MRESLTGFDERDAHIANSLEHLLTRLHHIPHYNAPDACMRHIACHYLLTLIKRSKSRSFPVSVLIGNVEGDLPAFHIAVLVDEVNSKWQILIGIIGIVTNSQFHIEMRQRVETVRRKMQR